MQLRDPDDVATELAGSIASDYPDVEVQFELDLEYLPIDPWGNEGYYPAIIVRPYPIDGGMPIWNTASLLE